MSQSATSTRFFEPLQGRGLPHCPGQPGPTPDHSFRKEIFPNLLSKPPLMQLEVTSPRPITGSLGEETNPRLTTTCFQVIRSPLMKVYNIFRAGFEAAFQNCLLLWLLSPGISPISGCRFFLPWAGWQRSWALSARAPTEVCCRSVPQHGCTLTSRAGSSGRLLFGC